MPAANWDMSGTTADRIFAEGLRPSAKAIRPSAKAFRGLPSTKSPWEISRRQRDLYRGPFVGHSAKILPRADAGLRGKKMPLGHGAATDGVFAGPKLGPRQRIF